MVYKTRDTETASLLKSQNRKFTTEKQGQDVVFVFEDKEECEAILDLHNNRELIVKSADLFEAIHAIKKIIINLKNK